MIKEQGYKTIFEDEAEGVKIVLMLKEDAEEKSDKPFNINFALMELSNQLAEQARKGVELS